jgi:hypothetical protein
VCSKQETNLQISEKFFEKRVAFETVEKDEEEQVLIEKKKLHEIGVSLKTSSKIMVVPTCTENGCAYADVCNATNVHV